jgi:Condensation domain
MAIKIRYQGYDLEFDHYPTKAEIEGACQALQVLVSQRLENPGYATIQPAQTAGELPISFAQEWLWSLEQMAPGNPTYHLPFGVRLSGRLDAGALECAIIVILTRHQVLRAAFISVDGRPVQIIGPVQAPALPVLDTTAVPKSAGEAECARVLRAESRRHFDFAHGPMVRAVLLRLGIEEHVLFLMVHHIAADAWSLNLLIRELITLYESFSQGKPSPLGELPIQYSDYAHWQRNRLQAGMLEELISYWKLRLAGAPSSLSLPRKHLAEYKQISSGARSNFALGAELSESLQLLGNQVGVTLFVVLLAAFQALLYRWSGQDDIVVGSPIAGRSRVETEGLMGCFINTLPLRTDLSGNPRFRELLRQVHAVTIGAFSHQDLPFDKIVEAIRPERSAGRTPLYAVIFDLNNTPPVENVDLKNLKIRPLGIEIGIAKVALLLDMWWSGPSLLGSIEYSTDLFDTIAIERFAEQFTTLLQNIVRGPDVRLNAIDVISARERQKRMMDERTHESYRREKFKSVKARVVKLPST